MECNKDEAIRAREIAEKKLQNSDFVGAKKFALKSQQLYPNLDNISMILAICEVHCSAQNKMIGLDKDWYDVLQIEKVADEAMVKKQYRKLALLLHPDKNKFAGAEAAFKLVGEANRVLSNKTTRSVFDLKVKAFMKSSISKMVPPSHTSNRGTVVNKHKKTQHTDNISANQPFMATAPQKNSQNSQKGLEFFGMICPHCRVSVKYFKSVHGRQITCLTCKSTFTANYTQSPIDCPNTSSSKTECFSSKGNSGSFHMSHEPAGKASEYNGETDRHPVPKSMPAPTTGAGIPASNSKQKFDGVGKVNVEAQKSRTNSAPRQLVLGLMAITSNSKNKKRGWPEFVDLSHRSIGVRDVNAEDDHVKKYSEREGKRDAKEPFLHKRNASYAASVFDEGELATSSEMQEMVHNNIKRKNEAGIGKGLKDHDPISFATTKNGVEKDVKCYNGSSHKEMLSNKKRRLMKQSTSNLVEEDADAYENKDSGLEPGTFSVIYECMEPEFSNFDNEKRCFDVDQIWAAYDTIDAMPRFYAIIRKVISADFKLEITWLEPDTRGVSNAKWIDKGLPTACGAFKCEGTGTEVITGHLMFSHRMDYELGNVTSSFVINPRVSEIWALFRNWDISWADDPEKHKPYKFEFVVVLSDFDHKEGVKVAHLKKLRGFVSLFRRMTRDEGSSPFHIPPGNLFQFSHRIPAFQMSGTERDGVPEGSYELDTASLPIDMNELDDLPDGKVGNGRKDYTESIESLRAPFRMAERNDTCKKQCSASSNQDSGSRVVTLENPTAALRRSPRVISSKKNSNL